MGASLLLTAFLLTQTPLAQPAKAEPKEEFHYTLSSSRSLLFQKTVERTAFHFQIIFGLGGGPQNEGLFHAMEVGGTFSSGWTLALLHTFVQNKGIIGPERGPDLIGGWMIEVKCPIFWPEFELKFAIGLGGLHDQSNGIRAIPGVGWAYGLDFHIPFFRNSGMTVGLTLLHAAVPSGPQAGYYFTAGLGLGYTFF